MANPTPPAMTPTKTPTPPQTEKPVATTKQLQTVLDKPAKMPVSPATVPGKRP